MFDWFLLVMLLVITGKGLGWIRMCRGVGRIASKLRCLWMRGWLLLCAMWLLPVG